MKAAIIGATGLVGQQLLRLLLDSERYAEVHTIGRRKIELDHPRLIQHTIELDKLGGLEIDANINHGFCTLGTTIKQAGSPEAFKLVDRDYVCEFGKLLKRLGVTAVAVNSSLGADSQSRNLYLQTKGEMEECLRDYGFDALVIVRPSLLVPAGRKEFRLGEILAFNLFRFLGWLLIGPLRRYRPVKPASVAQTLFDSVLTTSTGTTIFESESIHD